MKQETLHKILSCKSLPSLPAVALRVIEQTSDPNLKLAALATTIQNDQGLAAKVLKTVNSSFYGLRSPCSNISKSLVLLGLAPVKTLVLGFSLVNAIGSQNSAATFDYVSYWRRGLYTAVASKAIAEAAGESWGDEAFLSGLLQDIGVIAMLSALGDEYVQVMASAGDHGELSRVEAETLESSHAEVGAMLAERWRLPVDLVMPVRYHDRPTAAPVEHADRCRCVALANLVHDVLTDEDPREAMGLLRLRAQHWFRLNAEAIDDIVRRCSEGARELSRLFNLDTGGFKSVDEIMATAQVRLEELKAGDPGGSEQERLDVLVKDGAEIDPLTGVHSRASFTSMVREAFAAQAVCGGSAMLVQFAIDVLPGKAPTSQEAADDRVVHLAGTLKRRFGSEGAAVCRVSHDLFAVVLTSAAERVTHALIEAIRTELGNSLSGVSINVGMARQSATVSTPQDLVVAATRSLQAARRAGPHTSQGASKAA
jgi:two-component system, cell cycle response regulator